MNGCEWLPRVAAYHDEEMAADAVAPFERHLTTCAQCTAELAELRRVSGLFQDLAVQQMRGDSIARIHDAVNDEPEPQSNLLWIGGMLAGLAASALIIGSAWLMELPADKPPPIVVAIHPPNGSWEQVAISDRGLAPLPRGLWEAPDQPMLADARTAEWMLQSLGAGGTP